MMRQYQIVHETWLTRLVGSYGDIAVVQISQTIYQSGLFKIAMIILATLAFLNLAWGIHRGQFSTKATFFFIALTLLSPLAERPAAYIIVNAGGQSLAWLLEKAVMGIVSNSRLNSERSNLPPGIVLEMITAAASSKLESQEAQSLLEGFVANCLPNALTKDGEHANFDDLFNYEVQYRTDSVSGRTVTTFREKALDERALKNDNSYGAFRAGRNCWQGLEDVRLSLQNDLAARPLELTNRVIEGPRIEGQEITSEAWVKNWQAKATKLKDLAMNLRMAHAASYEKSRLISEHGWDLNDPSGTWWQGTHTDASLRELLISGGAVTEFSYRLSDMKNILANTTGNRWAFSLGAAIKDLKERIELVPYNLAAIKLLLKILCPLFLLTLFLQTFRFFFMWVGAWFAALLIPSIISASRAIGNSILLSKLGIEKLANSDGSKALAHGVDLAVAKDFLGDFVPLAYSLIEQELMVIKALSGALLVGSWIAGGGANGFVSWLSNSIQGNLTSMAITRGVSHAASGLTKALPVMGRMAGGAAMTVGTNASKIVDSIRGEAKADSKMNRLFPRRN